MISNRELKDQIEQLNEQNQYLTDELRGIKQLLQKQMDNKGGDAGSNVSESDSNGNQSSPSNRQSGNEDSSGSSNGNADSSSNESGNNSSNQNSDSNQSQNSKKNQNDSGTDQNTDDNSNNQNQLSMIAKDFSKLKELTNQLENKMHSYISKNTSGNQLTEEDVMSLILGIMNGMIDWTTDILSTSNNQSNQVH